MASFERKSYFTNDELAVLQQAFDLACADLRLDATDRWPRERLGAFLFEIAAHQPCRCAMLRRRAVLRFGSLAGAGQSGRRPPADGYGLGRDTAGEVRPRHEH